MAFECFADEDVVEFLRRAAKLPCKGWHGGNQGNVIKGVFLDGRADVGIVDEDPGKSHHPLRDRLELRKATGFIEVRQRKGRHLIIVKPELEECFLASASRVGFETKLPRDPARLRRLLGKPGGGQHAEFREELQRIHDLSVEKKIATLATDLVEALQEVLKERDG